MRKSGRLDGRCAGAVLCARVDTHVPGKSEECRWCRLLDPSQQAGHLAFAQPC